jgi:hypothetical protein
MAMREFVPNQVFVGLPWKNVRPRYDKAILKLHKSFPLFFTIVGRNDGQDAGDLFEIIKARIASSSYAVFDATGGNANVSLEYGYAEGIDVPRAIYLSAHKATQRAGAGNPIISDLGGKRRVQYKTEKSLLSELQRLCKEHDYNKRFEKALVKATKGQARGAKKSSRALALKMVRALDGRTAMRRLEFIQHIEAQGYKESVVDSLLKKLHAAGVLKCTVGKSSQVYIA